MTPRAWTLAIDFGTTSTVAAVHSEGERPQVLEIDGQRRLPSVVLIDDDGSVVVGSAGAGLASSRPDRAIRAPKTRLGEQVPVVLGGQPHQAADLVAHVLRHVLDEAIRHQGSLPLRTRLTYPANWNRPRRARFLEAATKAGLPDPVLVPEPVAAALTYAEQTSVPSGQHVAVYDLGGGTFDTAVLQATSDGFKVVGRPLGDQQLGGELFDEMLMNHVGERIEPDTWDELLISDDPGWRRAAARLRDECKRVKETLSTHSYGEVNVGLPDGMIELRVQREELEALVSPYIDESVDLLDRCIADAGVAPVDLAAIYVTGGASRMPLVEEKLRAAYPNVAINRQGDPKTAVALGALVATPASLDLSLAASPGRTTLEGSGDKAVPPTPPSTQAPPTPPPIPPKDAAPTAPPTSPAANPTAVDRSAVAPPPAAAPPQAPTTTPVPPRPVTPVGAARATAPPVAHAAPAGGVDPWFRQPLALAGGFGIGILAIALIAFGLTRSGDNPQATDDGPTTTDGTGSTPTTSTTSTTNTTSTPSTAPSSGPTQAQIDSVVLSQADLGPNWVSFPPGDDDSSICDVGDLYPEPVRSAEGLFEPADGLAFDFGLDSTIDWSNAENVTTLASTAGVYETAEDAARVIELDADLINLCDDATIDIGGVAWSVEVVAPDADFPALGDGTTAAGFTFTNAFDNNLIITVAAVEIRWGRTVVTEAAWVFGREPNDEDIKLVSTNIITTFARLSNLPK